MGVAYLWVFPPGEYDFWPHYLMLSFYTFAGLMVIAVLISLLDRNPTVYEVNELDKAAIERPTKRVWVSWIALAIVMIALYLFFNGH
ncbi:hypothetical protein D3C87_1731770 [compost metagenome]